MMAVDLSKLVSKRKIGIAELNGKRVAIDAYNVLYQFLSIIRQPDGTPLMDGEGRVTSHLSGLFYRTIEIVDRGVVPIYVFDGLPSHLKLRTIEMRMRRRKEAMEAWQEAKERGDIAEAGRRAQASTRIDRWIVESSKELLGLMGVPYINAPGEGEAQASFMCRDGVVYAAASQDYDTLLFGSPLVVRNLTISGRRKLPMKNIYVTVEPEIVSLADTLAALGLSQKQLIWAGMLLGTDFNEGIKGAGPKTAVKIAKASSTIDEVKGAVMERFGVEFQTEIEKVEELFNNPEREEISAGEMDRLMAARPDREGIVDFMCERHGFIKERIEKFADKLIAKRGSAKQGSISKWL